MLAVEVKNIKKTFKTKKDTVEAVKDVSFLLKKERYLDCLDLMVLVNLQQF